MTHALRTPDDYELFIYSLTEQFPIVQRSTVRFIRLGTTLARVTGELYFENQVQLVVRERVVYDRLPAVIDEYGYEVWRAGEELYWYDPQPHPGIPSLQVTHPHHKHIFPDMEHNRIPAPGLGFARPNLPALIGEIEDMLRTLSVG